MIKSGKAIMVDSEGEGVTEQSRALVKWSKLTFTYKDGCVETFDRVEEWKRNGKKEVTITQNLNRILQYQFTLKMDDTHFTIVEHQHHYVAVRFLGGSVGLVHVDSCPCKAAEQSNQPKGKTKRSQR